MATPHVHLIQILCGSEKRAALKLGDHCRRGFGHLVVRALSSVPTELPFSFQDIYKQKFVETVKREGSKDLMCFEHKKVKYVWNREQHNFVQLRFADS